MVPQESKIRKIIKLRRGGYSYREICLRLKVSRRDISKYCKNLEFSKAGIIRYNKFVKGIKKPIKKQKDIITPQKARIIGHLFFDGSVFNTNYHYVLSYVNSSYPLVKQFIKDIKYIYNLLPSSFEKNKGKNVNIFRVKYYSKDAYLDVKRYSRSYSTSKKINIPNEIINGNKNIKLEFLRAFWEDEGSISTKGGIKISADLKSYEFIKQLGKLHEYIGIAYNISRYIKKGQSYYKLYLKINKKNVRLFYNYRLFNLVIASRGENIRIKKSEILRNILESKNF